MDKPLTRRNGSAVEWSRFSMNATAATWTNVSARVERHLSPGFAATAGFATTTRRP